MFHRVFLHRSTTRPRPEHPPDDGVDSSHAAAGLGLTHATHAAHAVGWFKQRPWSLLLAVWGHSNTNILYNDILLTIQTCSTMCRWLSKEAVQNVKTAFFCWVCCRCCRSSILGPCNFPSSQAQAQWVSFMLSVVVCCKWSTCDWNRRFYKIASCEIRPWAAQCWPEEVEEDLGGVWGAMELPWVLVNRFSTSQQLHTGKKHQVNNWIWIVTYSDI